jgi:hypothetical protein
MKTADSTYRLALGLAFATALLLLFGIGALGIIGEGGRPDRVYLAVLAVLAVGSVAARLRPRGMAMTLAAAALAQIVMTLVAMFTETAAVKAASIFDIIGINAMYAILFGVSAWLFRRANAQRSPTTASAAA